MLDNSQLRKAVGERLRKFRKDRGLTAYRIARQGGIRIDQVKAVETGETNYTIDVFFGYIEGSDLYMYFAEKSEDRKKPHDFDDLARKATEDPDK